MLTVVFVRVSCRFADDCICRQTHEIIVFIENFRLLATQMVTVETDYAKHVRQRGCVRWAGNNLSRDGGDVSSRGR